jgi:hypothetical protein
MLRNDRQVENEIATYGILSQDMTTLVQIGKTLVLGGDGHEVSDGSAIRRWEFAAGHWIWVCVLDLVASLLAFANDVCDAAEDAFAFLGAAFVAIEDVGAQRELQSAGSWFVCCIPLVSWF